MDTMRGDGMRETMQAFDAATARLRRRREQVCAAQARYRARKRDDRDAVREGKLQNDAEEEAARERDARADELHAIIDDADGG